MQNDTEPGEPGSEGDIDESIGQGGDSPTESTQPQPSKTDTNTPAKAVPDKIEDEFGPPPDIDNSTDSDGQPKPAIHRRMAAWFTNLDKGHRLFYGALAAIVVIAAILSYILLHQPGPPVVASLPTYRPPTSTTVPSTLTGLQVDPAINKLQVTGVMIENSVFARPQSGLNQAGVVFEAIAEGGITRFMALFQDTQSQYIGPVRSARPYYVQWCQAFDCALAHVGGSPEALNDIKKWGVKNLDEFAGGQYFHRINSRYAPHNMYTSQAELSKYEQARGYKTSSYTGFEHLLKEPKVTKASITTTSINFDYPGSAYDVHYGYDSAHNDYLRSEGGVPHYSVSSSGKKTQNSPKVVIALVIAYSEESDDYHSAYASVGSGTAYVFQDGALIKGTWSRSARNTQFVLRDSNGQPIKLVPGQTWVSVLGANGDVSYK